MKATLQMKSSLKNEEDLLKFPELCISLSSADTKLKFSNSGGRKTGMIFIVKIYLGKINLIFGSDLTHQQVTQSNGNSLYEVIFVYQCRSQQQFNNSFVVTDLQVKILSLTHAPQEHLCEHRMSKTSVKTFQ